MTDHLTNPASEQKIEAFKAMVAMSQNLSKEMMKDALWNLQNAQAGNASRCMRKALEIMVRLDDARKESSDFEQDIGAARLAQLRYVVRATMSTLSRLQYREAQDSIETIVGILERMDGSHLNKKALANPSSEVSEDDLFRQAARINKALCFLNEILDVAEDYELDEIQEQSLMTAQQVMVSCLAPSWKMLEEYEVSALGRCVGELQDFIDSADEYDLNQEHINALKLGIESMQERIDAAGRTLESSARKPDTPSVSGVDKAALERAARAVAKTESWDGWDDDSATPNGNTPDEQRTWCREVAHAVLTAVHGQELSVVPTASVDTPAAAMALDLLKEYRAAPKFSNDHDAIKRTVALEDRIDEFLASLEPAPPNEVAPIPKRKVGP